MAKSAGNFQRITDLAAEGIDPLAFRYLTMTARYRRPLDYSDASIAAAASGLESLRSRLRALGPPPAEGPWRPAQPLLAGEAPARPEGIADGVAGHGNRNDGWPLADRASSPAAPLSPIGRRLHDRFVASIDDDLDLPRALAVARETLRADIPADERRWLVLDADMVLGLDLHRAWERRPELPSAAIPREVRALADRRAAARSARDFTAADALRDQLADLGWEVVDRPDGTELQRR